MGQADLIHGSAILMVDHTPGSALTAGDVVVVDEFCYVAHADLAASVLGAVAARGGVYEMTADGAIGAGDKVFWDESAGKVTITADAGNNKHFGNLSPDSSAAADGDKVRVIHAPDGTSV